MDSPESSSADRVRAHHPSIFNDVIGPVMRGPSSSHCAAANRIGLLARQLAGGRLERVAVRYDVAGALATTHASQGSDMGLFGGLLGWDVRDERIVDSARAIAASGIDVDISIGDFGHSHPSTYHLILESEGERHEIVAISTGGGMIEVVEIDGCPVSFLGDRHAVVVWGAAPLKLLTFYREPAPHVISTLASAPGVTRVRTLSPVLPTLSPNDVSVPFSSCAGMASFNGSRGLTLADLAVTYECERSGEPEDAVMGRMIDIVKLLRASVAAGLSGTDYDDRILGPQAAGYARAGEERRLVDLGALNRVIAYVTALMEVKSSMGLIVAAPTAGACAAFPGSCLGLGDEMGADDEEVARAMFAGGMIGAFIARGSTFSAELAGCQAECGSASGMAAAAIVQMQWRNGGAMRGRRVDGSSEHARHDLRPRRRSRGGPLPRKERHGRLERSLVRQHGARRVRSGHPARRGDRDAGHRREEPAARAQVHRARRALQDPDVAPHPAAAEPRWRPAVTCAGGRAA